MSIHPLSPRWKTVLSGVLLFLILLPAQKLGISAGGNPQTHTTGASAANATPAPTTTPQTRLYLPFTTNNFQTLEPSVAVATLDSRGTTRTAFLPQELIYFQATGRNFVNSTGTAQVVWVEEGPCGTRLIHSGALMIDDSGWTITEPIAANKDCPGLYTQTLEVTDGDQKYIATSRYAINHEGQIVISNQQAFDKCDAASSYDMKVWWDKSYYYSVNLYIGGISRYCENKYLDGVWVNEVKNMGWMFIPTWVGPQAPCSKFRYRMSSDATRAYQEGRREADMALEAAADIGLRGEQVIYYDLESYGSNPSTSCRNTVASFMRGWSDRLHEAGSRSGVYGSSCTSYLSDFAYAGIPVDNVWAAQWITPYAYNRDAGVFGLRCMSDNLWANHQRIRQYTGGHVETWGGVSMSIDSNALDGEVVSMPRDTRTIQSGSNLGMTPALPTLEAMQLLGDNQGWVLSEGQFFWTENGGEAWEIRTPALRPEVRPAGAFLQGIGSGWLVTADAWGQVELFVTADQGKSWQAGLLPVSTFQAPVRKASFEFIDDQNGWLSLELESSSNFSLGELFATTDGGQTWELRSLPGGEVARFTDAEKGWVDDSQRSGRMYTTDDGGLTWEETVPQANTSDQAMVAESAGLIDIPDGTVEISAGGPGEYWVLVREGNCSGEKVSRDQNEQAGWAPFSCVLTTRFLHTVDSGASWEEISLP